MYARDNVILQFALIRQPHNNHAKLPEESKLHGKVLLLFELETCKMSKSST